MRCLPKAGSGRLEPRPLSVAVLTAQHVSPVQIGAEEPADRRMVDWFLAVVEQYFLLTAIRDIAAFAIFRAQAIRRLITVMTHILRSCLITYLAIREGRINFEQRGRA